MRGLVEGDPALQLLFADVAPWADVVGGDGDVEVCHFAEVRSQDDAGRSLRNATGFFSSECARGVMWFE